MDFVAIDFETANQRPESACQVAAVVVRNSQIAEQHEWLIRPPTNYFAPINISIHGIRPEDVAQSPTMERVWQELHQLIDGHTMIAHNARFDMGVLVASLSAFDVAIPQFEFQCTKVLAKATWPSMTRYGLKPLGTWLGIQFKHHNALEDARCCAQIAIAAESVCGPVASLEDLEARLGLQRGFYRNQRIFSPKRKKIDAKGGGPGLPPFEDLHMKRKYGMNSNRQYSDQWGFPLNTGQRPPGSLCADTVRESCTDLPLAGKNIVMLGPLRGLTKDETQKLLSELGANVQSTITPTTHYVVAAGTPLSDARRVCSQIQSSAGIDVSNPSNSQCNSPNNSFGIRVLSERQFRAMLLPGGAISV